MLKLEIINYEYMQMGGKLNHQKKSETIRLTIHLLSVITNDRRQGNDEGK